MRAACVGRKTKKKPRTGAAERKGSMAEKRLAEEEEPTSDEAAGRANIRRTEVTEEEVCDNSSGARDEDTGEPGEKRLRRAIGKSRGIIERGMDVDQPTEEE